MGYKCLFAPAIASWLWSAGVVAADLETNVFRPYGWRNVIELAKTPICDPFRGSGRLSDAEVIKHEALERRIKYARAQIYTRRANVGEYTEMVLPEDYMRACK